MRLTPRPAPSLAERVSELAEAAREFDERMSNWSKYHPHEVGAAAVRLAYAKRALRDCVVEPVGVS